MPLDTCQTLKSAALGVGAMFLMVAGASGASSSGLALMPPPARG
jgi:hypothetical protein